MTAQVASIGASTTSSIESDAAGSIRGGARASGRARQREPHGEQPERDRRREHGGQRIRELVITHPAAAISAIAAWPSPGCRFTAAAASVSSVVR